MDSATPFHSKRQCRELLDMAHDAILVRDFDGGRIEYWNSGAEALYGWTAEQAIGQDPHELFHTRFPKPWAEIAAQLCVSGYWEGELLHHHRNGSPIRVSSRRSLYRDEAGRPHLFEINRDITAYVSAMKETSRFHTELASVNRLLESRNREVEQLLETKNRFLATMSHELRTPLNAILGFSELLLEASADEAASAAGPGELNDKQRRYVGHIHGGGQQLLGLVNELLDLARIEAGQLDLDPRRLDLGEQEAVVMPALELLARKKEVELTFRPHPQLWVRADAARMQRILVNLVSNAVKFTPVGGRVWVTAEGEGEWVKITVGDTGVGIQPSEHEIIFEEFRQLGSGRQQPGVGLGLAITRRLVQAHGGRIWVESAGGIGSQFHFTLP
ncbi:MAG TPA: PAS domain-containing sensor histidine kinase, partial [Terriglobales bacterium]|nr:PAS domain-containing sensor histidine kinase [Terriglobales bacterium]